jgi:Tfp pilus assembly protein PilX
VTAAAISMTSMNPSPSRQRGAALFVSLVMLAVITLFVVAAINMSTVNLRITANTQARGEAVAAAQQAIEQVVSAHFPANPQGQTIAVNLHNDPSKTDYTVTVARPTCVNTVAITQQELAEKDDSDPDDVACRGSASVQNSGMMPPLENNSFCRTQQWDVSATVDDGAFSATTVNVHQGIATRVDVGKTC